MFSRDEVPSLATNEPNITEARNLANERTAQEQQRRKRVFNEKHPKTSFAIGSRVIRRLESNHPDLSKLSPRWTGPYYALKQVTPLTYDIALTLTDDPVRAHVSQLKEFVPRAQTQQPGADVANEED